MNTNQKKQMAFYVLLAALALVALVFAAIYAMPAEIDTSNPPEALPGAVIIGFIAAEIASAIAVLICSVFGGVLAFVAYYIADKTAAGGNDLKLPKILKTVSSIELVLAVVGMIYAVIEFIS